MTRKIARVIGIFMFFAAVIFIIVVCNDLQMSFLWSNTITYILYIVSLVKPILCLFACVIIIVRFLYKKRKIKIDFKDGKGVQE